ncbi:prenyltransferase/squalene oxidase repeat-containing protein [Streptomyces sp. FIT100]|uniref:terpene cyclase/mutase family protein n=1 Tax=Streptomyces sp. FIT100 TaxID=2837956 RepID=UPI0021C93557|nr:prenyltransferase/squalene oxidase repeat-containing protein [Streptomyces sp. FIT100]UUN26330.1 squalene--hopene cyclase [Streptomyces sp. FIT100]
MIDQALSQLPERAAMAVARARVAMLAAQSADGYWHYGVENKVTVGAHDLLAREFLGVRTARETTRTAAWIRSIQSGDGGWPGFHGGPDDISATVIAYAALRLAGDAPSRPHMRAAADGIARLGGLERCRNSARLWLALAGLWPWEKVRTLPPELFLLPRRTRASLYEVASWARQVIVAVSILGALRPVWPVGFDLAELPGWRAPATRTGRRRPPYAPLRCRALRAMQAWMRQRQDVDGCWGGVHATTVHTLLALHVLGESAVGPLMRSALAGLDTFADDDGPMRRVRFSHSPVWDTAHVILALRAAGVPAGDPSLARAAAWLLGRQCEGTGDWAVHRPGLPPGGWSFQFANAHYPDCDDTALVVRALRAVASSTAPDGAVSRGLRWLSGMVCGDGGWAAFDADTAVTPLRRLRITDTPALLFDETTADVTAHAVEALAAEGPQYAHVVHAGANWLLRAQEYDGSWYGRWGCNHVYGTSAGLAALRASGLHRDHPAIRRGAVWLLSHQNPDGGWGEDHRSYLDAAWRGRGESSASQTAWALQGLLSAGAADGPAVRRGVDWLVRRQLSDGTWQEPQYTGTGMPWRSPIRYRCYPVVFPTLALTQYLKEHKHAT